MSARHTTHAGHKVVVAGGGVAGLEAMLALRALAQERVEIELIAPERDFVYRPLAVAEPFGLGRPLRFDLAAITADSGTRYRPDALGSVDGHARRVRTRSGDEISYDSLIVACGARRREALPGAITFWGVDGRERIERMLADVESGAVDDVAFALPGGCGWPFPLYELALLTAAHLASRGCRADLTLVTPEAAPLEVFGTKASEGVRELLAERGIGLLAGSWPESVHEGELVLSPAGRVAADRVVTLPRVQGLRLEGLPCDERGFIPTDRFGQVEDLEGVYAAGDATTVPIKQGGLAAQMADVIAQCVAQLAGAPVAEPRRFEPVLRGLLLTGHKPRYLRAEMPHGAAPDSSTVSEHALWWPPGKIAGRYLAPYIAGLANADVIPPPPRGRTSLQLEVDLDAVEVSELHPHKAGSV